MRNKCMWLRKNSNNKYFCGYAADGHTSGKPCGCAETGGEL